jgi:hypothetical protein
MRTFIVKRRPGSGLGRPLWLVEEGEEIHGDYLSEWAALLDAIDAAQEAGEQGSPAEVVVAQAYGPHRRQWRYGLDPYPYEDAPAPLPYPA